VRLDLSFTSDWNPHRLRNWNNPPVVSAGKIRSSVSSLVSGAAGRAAIFGIACTLALLAVPLPMGGAAAATPPLSVVGGEGVRTLALRVCMVNFRRSLRTAEALASESCRSTAKDSSAGDVTISPSAVLVGSLTLDVTNTSSKPQRVTLYYRRNDGATAQLPGTYSYVYLAVRSSPGKRSFTIPAHVTVALPLHFTLTPHRPVSALEGTLYIGLSNYSQTVAVPLKVTVPAPPGLRLEPGELTLSNDRPGDRASTTVTLVGPGAAVFADAVDVRHKFVVHDSDDHEAHVSLSSFKELAPGVAEAKLSVANDPAPGAYKGELAVFSLSPEAPSLTVKINSHLAVWITILCVLLGVLAGGLAPRLYALNQRRDTLLRALRDARGRFRLVGNRLPTNVRCGIWGLEDLAEMDALSPEGEVRESGRLPGVEALYARIERARNDRDLDEDTNAVLEVVARIQRWLRLAPAVWELLYVVAEKTPSVDKWRDSITWRDTCLLQACLVREPPDAKAADDLVERVLWQIQWYRNVARLYRKTAANQRSRVLRALEKPLEGKTVLERTGAERDALNFKLKRLAERLDIKLAAMRHLDGLPGAPELAVDWHAAPSLFTGWATIDGISMRNLRARAFERGRVRTPKPPKPPKQPLTLSNLRAKVGSWIFQLLLPLLAASIFYAVTIYTETWGSFTDVLTALTAGFAGKVLIDYGTLAVFQSSRLSTTTKKSAAPASAASAAETRGA
jgi:hypothetical protein